MSKTENILFRPWKKLRHLQNEKLHYFVTHKLYPFSPYYRKLFDDNKIKPSTIKSVKDLERIPFTSKKDFIEALKGDPSKGNLEFLLAPNKDTIKRYLPKLELLKFTFIKLFGERRLREYLDKEYRPIFLTATAGTTGQPMPFLYSSFDMKNLEVYGRRIIEIMGVGPQERAMNVFPYAPHLAFWQTFFAGIAGNRFIISTGGGKTIGTKGNIRTLMKVKPKFLIGTPSYVYHILRTAKELELDLSFLDRIVLGAARVPKGFKQKILNFLLGMGSRGAKITGTYGFTEARCAWVECPTDLDVCSGYHTYPDKEIFEIVDPDSGQVKSEGEDGELVYTNIDARGSCLMRYRTGDLVKGGIKYEPCPYCGRTVPRISNDISRASNLKNVKFSKIKGTIVNLNNLEYLLDDKKEIDNWQIEIVKKNDDPYEVDELVFYVNLIQGVNKEEFISVLSQEIRSETEVSFNRINFVSTKEIQERAQIESSIKAKRIVDKRKKI